MIWGWRTFRKIYAALGIIKQYFPKMPIPALFATITSNILRYIKELLHLYKQTLLYKQQLYYPNITQIVTPIIKQGFVDLDYLVPKVGIISKTKVFMKKIEDIMALATHLQRLLLPEDCDQGDDLIMTFYSTIEAIIQVDIIEKFWDKKIRILICIDVVEMGVNISNITHVI